MPDSLTPGQTRALKGLCVFLAVAIRDYEEVPSDHLYMAVTEDCPPVVYEHAISVLVKSKLIVRKPNDLLVWNG